MTENHQKALVIGAGIAGIQTALDLAKTGRDVVLIDKAVSIGGLVTRLDRTFPTNNCDLCSLSPDLSETGRREHIRLMAMTELSEFSGEAGRFEAVLKTRPRYIDPDKCTACGECVKHFSECVGFTPGLLHGAPACMRYPQSTPHAYSIDMDKCRDIEEVAAVCPAGAIFPDDRETFSKMTFGAVILATGAELFDYRILDNFGGGEFPNVVSGLEYERIMSASGPTSGELARPSDGKMPRKVAWLQCVGSRGINQNDVSYCSGVCCMYALKEAIVTKERFKDDIEAAVFYMDMRTSGKDYELYRNRAEQDYGVRLIQSRPHSIMEKDDTKDLELSYISGEESALETELFDMIVLSTGFRMPESMKGAAEVLGIELNRHRFVETPDFSPVETSRPGVYACGVCEGPKDIPETMIQSAAAMSLACRDLGDPRKGEGDDGAPVPERDVRDESPRVGVFVCDCGSNIGGVIDVARVAERAGDIPGVAVSQSAGHGCSAESIRLVQSVIQEQKLNRVVIAGCSPRTHEAKFQDAIRGAGLNRYLLEMANIRDQNTWAHMDQPQASSDKALEQIHMAVERVRLRRPMEDHSLPVNKDILVAGGGVAGMTAALTLAEQGFKVFLVEQSPQLGGMARNIRRTLSGQDVREFVADLIERTLSCGGIEVLTGSTIVDHQGMPGMFSTGVQVAPRMYYRRIDHGAAIIATGALHHTPDAYLLNGHEASITQYDLDSIIEDDPDSVKDWESVVMIQCVGSRDKDHPNCSRICCQTAIKNALRIADASPDARIYVFHKDIRTLGFQEDFYIKAREKGILFFRYDPENPPEARAEGDKIVVGGRDRVLGRNIEISADRLVLSCGMKADDEATEDLAAIFSLNRTADGFFLEEHTKLRPSDLSKPGFMTAGTAHGPKTIRESVAQAQAAAGRAMTFLSEDFIELGSSFAQVDSRRCAACLICVRACPYGVPFINADGRSEIDPAKCHGCGICASECPAKAIQLVQCDDDMISAELNGLFSERPMK